MTIWLVLYNFELENSNFKVDNFYVFVSLVQTIDELKAAHKKAMNNMKEKAEKNDEQAKQELLDFTIDRPRIFTGPHSMGVFPTLKEVVQLPSVICNWISLRWNSMRRVLTNQGQQAPPQFNEMIAKHNSYRLWDKYPILPGQDATSSHQQKVQFAKVRSQFITDCSNAVNLKVKNVLLSHQPIALAGAAVSPPQTSTMASTRALSGMASVPATNRPHLLRCGSTCG